MVTGGTTAEAIRQVAREFALRPPGWRQNASALILQVLLHIHRGKSRHATACDPRLARLTPALALLEKRLADPGLQVGDLARAVSVSEVTLRRLFREALGAGPQAVLRRRRIDHARNLLKTTELPIKAIAMECGFTETRSFHCAFRQLVGATPGAYRRQPEL